MHNTKTVGLTKYKNTKPRAQWNPTNYNLHKQTHCSTLFNVLFITSSANKFTCIHAQTMHTLTQPYSCMHSSKLTVTVTQDWSVGCFFSFPLFSFFSFFLSSDLVWVCVFIAFCVFNFRGDAYFHTVLVLFTSFFTLGSQALTSGHWRLYATSCKKLDADR